MTRVPELKYKNVGNLSGLKNWVEYGLKQSQNELDWSDCRVTEYSRIEKWWEIIMSIYLRVSLQTEEFKNSETSSSTEATREQMKKHPEWQEGKGGQTALNNLRLFLQPRYYFNLLKPWLLVFSTPQILHLFCRLFFSIVRLTNSLLEKISPRGFYLSSA
jgi:hypothetical protein